MSTIDYIIIGGFILSIIGLVLRWLDKRKKIKVKTTLGRPESKTKEDPIMLEFKAMNVGGQKVTLSSFWLYLNGSLKEVNEVPETPRYAIGKDELPYRLPPNESFSIYIPNDKIEESLFINKNRYGGRVMIKPCFKDQTEEIYKGEGFLHLVS